MFKNPSDSNYKYVLDYDLEQETDCEANHCDEYCRCGVITGCKVEKNFRSMHSFFTNLYNGPDDDMTRALAFWFIRMHFSNIEWTYTASGGYYGEELDSVTMEHDGGFWNKARMFESLDTNDRIEFLLNAEYGAVLSQVKAVKKWEIKAVFSAQVSNSLNTNLNATVLKDYTDFCQSLMYQESSRKKFQENVRHMAPLCLLNGDGYQVIDGRHRCTALQSDYKYVVAGKKTVKKTVKTKAGKVVKDVERQENVIKTFTPVYMWIICPYKEPEPIQ